MELGGDAVATESMEHIQKIMQHAMAFAEMVMQYAEMGMRLKENAVEENDYTSGPEVEPNEQTTTAAVAEHMSKPGLERKPNQLNDIIIEAVKPTVKPKENEIEAGPIGGATVKENVKPTENEIEAGPIGNRNSEAKSEA